MHKAVIAIFALVSAMLLFACINKAQEAKISSPPDHVQWVANSLEQMQSIKVGMTREDLLKVFSTEGGLSTRFQQTYVYRGCPYIKVNVEFAPVGDKQDKSEGKPEDRISKISRPYLEWSITD